MSPKTCDPHELDNSDTAWMRGVTAMAPQLNLRVPTFPMPTETVDSFFGKLGYVCNAGIRAREHGDTDSNFTVADARRLHAKLERGEYWQRFPCPCHDHKKTPDMLAIEVADWLHKLSTSHRMAWTAAVDWQWLLLLLASAIDPQTQADLLAICTNKLGLPSPTSTEFWADKCEAVGQLSVMIDAEPGSRAVE